MDDCSHNPLAMQFQPTRSDNEGSQHRSRIKYGSQPPKLAMSDAEISQWLLEAEQEDRRLAAIEQTEKRRVTAQQIGLGPSTDKQPEPASAARPRFHRGCKYRLPSTDPIAIPTIPYDPLDILWRHQDLRRRQGSRVKKALKKNNKAQRELTGFNLQSQNDVEDDSDDNEFNEQDGKQCPICSYSPEAVNQRIEIAVNQVSEIAIDQVTEIVVDQVTEIAVDRKTEIAVNQEIEIAVDAVAIITSTIPSQKKNKPA